MQGNGNPPKRIRWLGTVALALGGANLSILLLGSLIQTQGTISILFLMFGLIISFFASFGYLELVLMFPNRTGGITAACIDAFKHYNPILANLAGTCYWFAWLALISYGGLYAATAIQQISHTSLSVNVLATLLILLVTLINLLGLPTTQKIAIPFAIVATLLTILSAYLPIAHGQVNWQAVSHLELKAAFSGTFGEITAVMAGIYLVGWIAPGFENSLCYVGETINPKKNTTIAMFTSIALAGLFFIICPIIWLATLGPATLNKDLGVVFASIYAPLFGPYATLAAASFMLFNMMLCIFAPLAGPPRTMAELARQGLLPTFFAITSQSGVPTVATLVTAAIAIIIVWSGTPPWLIAATNFQYLLAISFASVAVWLLRRDAPYAPRLFKAPKLLINMGLCTALIWTLSTILGFQQYGLKTMIYGVVFSFFGIALFLLRKGSDRLHAGLKLFPSSLLLKLTVAMLFVLIIDSVGYILAIETIPKNYTHLIVFLEDIFVVVALMTLSVGLLLPGMIAHAAQEVNQAIKKLISGTLEDFTKAMQALGSGKLEDAHAQAEIQLISVRSKDEIGEMATSFNEMQEKIKKCAIGLDNAREGLTQARAKLTESNIALSELNQSLEKRVIARTEDLALKNQQLTHEIAEKKKLEIKTEKLNSKLIVAARRAGMADIATSILHNIGNAINSVNTSAGIIKDTIRSSKLNNLAKLDQLLQKHKEHLAEFLTEDKQGTQILAFIHELANTWSKDQKHCLEEMHTMLLGTQHVSEIIQKQNSLSSILGLMEEVNISELIEDALLLCKVSYERANITFIRDYQPIKIAVVDRTMLLQIIVNLIKNSIEAVTEASVEDKKIWLDIHPKDEQYFLIGVRDNGVGIDSITLTKIFSYGFTTKKKGHGYGLHNCVLSANEMGGHLEVMSEGKNKGASFILTLPYDKQLAGKYSETNQGSFFHHEV